MEITISSSKRLLGKALWTVKLEYIKIAAYNEARDVLRKATGRGGQNATPRGNRTVQIALDHGL